MWTGITGCLQDSLPSSLAIRLVTNNQIQPIPGLVQQMNLPEISTWKPYCPPTKLPSDEHPSVLLCPAGPP